MEQGVHVVANDRKQRKDAAANEDLTVSDATETAQLEAGVLDEINVDATKSEESPATEESSSSQTEQVNQSVGEQGPVASSLGVPLSDDMEAAMEEDIAGEATGVSRRNPMFTASAGADPYGPALRPARSAMRTGSQEADWFNRFRERLAGDSQLNSSASPTDHDSGELKKPDTGTDEPSTMS